MQNRVGFTINRIKETSAAFDTTEQVPILNDNYNGSISAGGGCQAVFERKAKVVSGAPTSLVWRLCNQTGKAAQAGVSPLFLSTTADFSCENPPIFEAPFGRPRTPSAEYEGHRKIRHKIEQNIETNSVQFLGRASAVGEVFGFARSSVHEHPGQMGCHARESSIHRRKSLPTLRSNAECGKAAAPQPNLRVQKNLSDFFPKGFILEMWWTIPKRQPTLFCARRPTLRCRP